MVLPAAMTAFVTLASLGAPESKPPPCRWGALPLDAQTFAPEEWWTLLEDPPQKRRWLSGPAVRRLVAEILSEPEPGGFDNRFARVSVVLPGRRVLMIDEYGGVRYAGVEFRMGPASRSRLDELILRWHEPR